MTLPTEAVTTDHRLETTAERASGELAKHRWHWTLDESNPDRVGIREYARQVGRHQSTVHRHASGYAAALAVSRPDETPEPAAIAEAVTKAAMGAETAAAAEAVAQARGTSLANAQRGRHTDETRRVREVARQLAEERGTSVEEEAPKVAETIVRAEKAEHAVQAERAAHADMRFFEMERYLISAKRELMRAVKLAPQVPWDEEHREMLTETVANVKALLGMLDSAIAGISGTDWDAELAKLGGER